MDGVETFRKVKEIRPEAVVMMMTAYAVEELVQQALEGGAFGIVYKPLDIEKVIDVIENASEVKEEALILVVDDDPGTCTALKSILIKKGHEVGITHNGEEAIIMARERAYDVILIDMKMPTINGLEIYFAIKEANPEAVAIMMTAHQQEMTDLVEQALKHDAYACLYKPFEMEELLGLIAEIWERKQKVG